MRVTVFFITNPGPVQVESITYRIEDVGPVDAIIKATRQAAKLTTVPISLIEVAANEPEVK